jgi:hypothetical protein
MAAWLFRFSMHRLDSAPDAAACRQHTATYGPKLCVAQWKESSVSADVELAVLHQRMHQASATLTRFILT